MMILSAFADEISPDPQVQIHVLQQSRVRFIEFRSIHKTNVLALSDAQLTDFHSQLSAAGIGISAIGSPIGKIPIDAPFEPHLEKFRRAIDIAHRFQTPNIRIFSYYPPEGVFNGDWSPYREEVLRRMTIQAELAATAGITLFHENEHRIYGDTAERVVDLFQNVQHPNLRAAYDAANYVVCHDDPVQAWERTKEYTSHFHIKDWCRGEDHHGRIPGTGDGKIAYSIRDAVHRGFKGFCVMEPHLRGGGPTGGVTGPDLFPLAVAAFRQILAECGAVES
ncbi:MAG: sugar phosphate isomerase/epimerase family protein [Gemmataceae bacterium]